MDKSFDKYTYVVIDVETTGVSQFDRICEIGLTKIVNGEISDKLETLINPCTNITNTIYHGIQDWMVEEAPTFVEVAGKISDFIDNAVLIAHNAPFDMRFLRYELQRLDTDLAHHALCTLKISRQIHPDYPAHRLDYLLERYRIINECPHRAGTDADSEALLFLEMKKKLENKGMKTLDSLKIWGLPYEHFWCDRVKVPNSNNGNVLTRDDL
jgi:DNA polymerase III epsilon subunit family exonuclease